MVRSASLFWNSWCGEADAGVPAWSSMQQRSAMLVCVAAVFDLSAVFVIVFATDH